MNRIKQLREEKGHKQQILADLLGLEISAISKLEKGRVPLKDEYIIKLANFFNVSTDYLLGNANIRNTFSDNEPEFVSLYSDYKEMDEEDKEILMNMWKAIKRRKK